MANPNFVYEEIARNCGAPCKWSIATCSYMYERCGDWCKKFCGKIDASKCVKKYLNLREREEREIVWEKGRQEREKAD